MGLRTMIFTLMTLTAAAAGCAASSGAGGGGAASANGGGGGTGGFGGAGGGIGGGAGPGPATGPCVPGTAYPQPNLAVTAALVYQGTGSGLFEGPVWVAQLGALFFSDMTFSTAVPPSTIHRLTPPSLVAPAIPNAGSNGLAAYPDGMIVACTHDTQSVSLFDPNTGGRMAIVSDYQGLPFNSPNDVTIHSDGTIYFTDPNYQAGGRPGPGMTGVYCVPPGGAAVLIDGTLNNPNGITLSPDQTVLYVGDASGQVSSYPVMPGCAPGMRTPFATVAQPDGMAIDCAGDLYVTSHGAGQIHVFMPNGTPLGQITVAPSLTNLAFGGADGMTLYATAGKTLYAIQMNVPGYPY